MKRGLAAGERRVLLLVVGVYGGVILVVGLTMYVVGARHYLGLATVPILFHPEMYRWSLPGKEPLARPIAIISRALGLLSLAACILGNL